MQLTTETLKMAKISGLDYAQTTDYMTSALRGFKLEMSEAQTVVDVYSHLAAISASDTAELATAMSKTASSADAVGSSFENTTAMLATMIEITREAPENLGTALKSIISRYGEMTTDPTKLVDSEGEELSLNKVDAALQSVGITLQDTNKEFRDFDDVILELSKSWDTIDKNTQRYIATVMAGNRQQSRFLAMVGNYERLSYFMKEAANSEDAALIQTLKTMDSIETKINQLSVTFQEFYTSSGIEILIKGTLDFITQLIERLNIMPKLFGKIPIMAVSIVTLLITTFKNFALLMVSSFSQSLERMKQDGQAKGRDIGKKTGEAIREETEKETNKTNLFSKGKVNKYKWGTGLAAAGSAISLLALSLGDLETEMGRTTAAIASGVGGIISAAGQFMTGNYIGGVITLVTSAVQAFGLAAESTEEKLNRLSAAIEDTKNKSIQSKNDLKTLKEYKERYDELNKTRNLSVEGQEEWIKLNAEIAEKYPELISYIDTEGNYIVSLSSAYDQLYEAKKQAYDLDLMNEITANIQALTDSDYLLQDLKQRIIQGNTEGATIGNWLSGFFSSGTKPGTASEGGSAAIQDNFVDIIREAFSSAVTPSQFVDKIYPWPLNLRNAGATDQDVIQAIEENWIKTEYNYGMLTQEDLDELMLLINSVYNSWEYLHNQLTNYLSSINKELTSTKIVEKGLDLNDYEILNAAMQKAVSERWERAQELAEASGKSLELAWKEFYNNQFDLIIDETYASFQSLGNLKVNKDLQEANNVFTNLSQYSLTSLEALPENVKTILNSLIDFKELTDEVEKQTNMAKAQLSAIIKEPGNFTEKQQWDLLGLNFIDLLNSIPIQYQQNFNDQIQQIVDSTAYSKKDITPVMRNIAQLNRFIFEQPITLQNQLFALVSSIDYTDWVSLHDIEAKIKELGIENEDELISYISELMSDVGINLTVFVDTLNTNVATSFKNMEDILKKQSSGFSFEEATKQAIELQQNLFDLFYFDEFSGSYRMTSKGIQTSLDAEKKTFEDSQNKLLESIKERQEILSSFKTGSLSYALYRAEGSIETGIDLIDRMESFDTTPVTEERNRFYEKLREDLRNGKLTVDNYTEYFASLNEELQNNINTYESLGPEFEKNIEFYLENLSKNFFKEIDFSSISTDVDSASYDELKQAITNYFRLFNEEVSDALISTTMETLARGGKEAVDTYLNLAKTGGSHIKVSTQDIYELYTKVGTSVSDALEEVIELQARQIISAETMEVLQTAQIDLSNLKQIGNTGLYYADSVKDLLKIGEFLLEDAARRYQTQEISLADYNEMVSTAMEYNFKNFDVISPIADNLQKITQDSLLNLANYLGTTIQELIETYGFIESGPGTYTLSLTNFKIIRDSLGLSFNELTELQNSLTESLMSNDSKYKDIYTTTKTIKDIEDARNHAVAAGDKKRINDLNEELGIAQEILLIQSREPDSYKFMGRDLGSLQGPLNYWEDVKSAYESIAEASKKGFMDYTDFYSIISHIGDMGDDLIASGVDFLLDSKKAAELIAQAGGALEVTSDGLQVNLKEVGLDVLGGVKGMGGNLKTAINEMARQQIELIDAQIAMLEGLVAWEEFGGEDGIDFSDIVNVSTIDELSGVYSWTEDFSNLLTNFKLFVEDYEIDGVPLSDALKSLSPDDILEFARQMQLLMSLNYDPLTIRQKMQELIESFFVGKTVVATTDGTPIGELLKIPNLLGKTDKEITEKLESLKITQTEYNELLEALANPSINITQSLADTLDKLLGEGSSDKIQKFMIDNKTTLEQAILLYNKITFSSDGTTATYRGEELKGDPSTWPAQIINIDKVTDVLVNADVKNQLKTKEGSIFTAVTHLGVDYVVELGTDGTELTYRFNNKTYKTKEEALRAIEHFKQEEEAALREGRTGGTVQPKEEVKTSVAVEVEPTEVVISEESFDESGALIVDPINKAAIKITNLEVDITDAAKTIKENTEEITSLELDSIDAAKASVVTLTVTPTNTLLDGLSTENANVTVTTLTVASKSIIPNLPISFTVTSATGEVSILTVDISGASKEIDSGTNPETGEKNTIDIGDLSSVTATALEIIVGLAQSGVVTPGSTITVPYISVNGETDNIIVTVLDKEGNVKPVEGQIITVPYTTANGTVKNLTATVTGIQPQGEGGFVLSYTTLMGIVGVLKVTPLVAIPGSTPLFQLTYDSLNGNVGILKLTPTTVEVTTIDGEKISLDASVVAALTDTGDIIANEDGTFKFAGTGAQLTATVTPWLDTASLTPNADGTYTLTGTNIIISGQVMTSLLSGGVLEANAETGGYSFVGTISNAEAKVLFDELAGNGYIKEENGNFVWAEKDLENVKITVVADGQPFKDDLEGLRTFANKQGPITYTIQYKNQDGQFVKPDGTPYSVDDPTEKSKIGIGSAYGATHGKQLQTVATDWNDPTSATYGAKHDVFSGVLMGATGAAEAFSNAVTIARENIANGIVTQEDIDLLTNFQTILSDEEGLWNEDRKTIAEIFGIENPAEVQTAVDALVEQANGITTAASGLAALDLTQQAIDINTIEDGATALITMDFSNFEALGGLIASLKEELNSIVQSIAALTGQNVTVNVEEKKTDPTDSESTITQTIETTFSVTTGDSQTQFDNLAGSAGDAGTAASTASGLLDTFVTALNKIVTSLNSLTFGQTKAANISNIINAINRLPTTAKKVKVEISISATGGTSSKITIGEAKGNVALAKGRKTLMGELGRELVVSGGRYFVVGENGSEFVDLADDAIVFNHLQTEKLLGKGKAGRGKPIKSDAASVSYATGNASGPAMASASDALATLYQLRRLWENLLTTSAKDLSKKAGGGGGGGGGGGSAEEMAAYVGKIEEWYNLLRQIANLEGHITYQQKVRENLLKGSLYVESLEKELAYLKEQEKAYSLLATLQEQFYKAKVAEIMDESNPWRQIFTVTEEGLLQYRDGDDNVSGGLAILSAVNDINKYKNAKEQRKYLEKLGFSIKKDATGKAIKDDAAWMEEFWSLTQGYIDEFDELYDSFHDALGNIQDNLKAQNELLQEFVDNQLSVEDRLIKAIEDREQAIIDKMEDQLNATKEASTNYIEGLTQTLAREKDMYNINQNQQETASLQRKLAILQRSGGSAADIKSLQDQLDARLQTDYFDSVQKQIDTIQEASDKQLEKLQTQIDIANESLEYQKENGLLWNEVYDIMQNWTPERMLDFIETFTASFGSDSALRNEETLKEALKELEIWAAKRDAKKIVEEEKARKTAVQAAAESGWQGYTQMAQTSFSDIYEQAKAQAKAAYTTAYTENIDDTSITDEARKEAGISAAQSVFRAERANAAWQNYLTTLSNNKEFTSLSEPSKEAVRQAYASTYGVNESIQEAQEAALAEIKAQIPKTSKGTVTASSLYVRSKPSTSSSKLGSLKKGATVTLTGYKNGWYQIQYGNKKAYVSGQYIKKKDSVSLPGFAQGGLANYTGLAMVHGSTKKPEAYLSAEQTSLIKKYVDSTLSTRGSTLPDIVSKFSEHLASLISLIESERDTNESFTLENVNINFNVDSIASDYDVRRAANQAMEEILRIARQSGTSTITRR